MADTAAVQAPVMNPLQHITNLDAASDFEKKHTPYIQLDKTAEGKTRVSFEVGHYFPHPNQPDHFIQSVHVYAGDANVAQFDFTPVVAWPKGCVDLDLPAGTVVSVIEHCNLHGRWKAEATVQ